MVRSRNLIVAAFTVFIGLATSAAAQSATLVAFENYSARNFDELFNREVEQRSIAGRLAKSSCSGANCSFIFQSVGVLITPVPETDQLDGLTWFCGKGCKPADLVIGISISLRVLNPGLPNSAYGAWLGDATDALKGENKSTSMVGSAKLTVGVYGALGLMAFISKQ